jgi:hypothetical protein
MIKRVRHGLMLIEPIYEIRKLRPNEKIGQRPDEVIQECHLECSGFTNGTCRYFGSLQNARTRHIMCSDAEVFHEEISKSTSSLSKVLELMHQ